MSCPASSASSRCAIISLCRTSFKLISASERTFYTRRRSCASRRRGRQRRLRGLRSVVDGERTFVQMTLDEPTIDLRVRRLDCVAVVHHMRAAIGKAAADAQELAVLRGYQTYPFARLLTRIGLQDR